MTIGQFWQKYNHCPLCKHYVIQGEQCDGCLWYSPIKKYTLIDNYEPTEEAIRAMNKEIDEL